MIEARAVNDVYYGARDADQFIDEPALRAALVENAGVTDEEAGHVLALIDRWGPAWADHIGEEVERAPEPAPDEIHASEPPVSPEAWNGILTDIHEPRPAPVTRDEG